MPDALSPCPQSNKKALPSEYAFVYTAVSLRSRLIHPQLHSQPKIPLNPHYHRIIEGNTVKHAPFSPSFWGMKAFRKACTVLDLLLPVLGPLIKDLV